MPWPAVERQKRRLPRRARRCTARFITEDVELAPCANSGSRMSRPELARQANSRFATSLDSNERMHEEEMSHMKTTKFQHFSLSVLFLAWAGAVVQGQVSTPANASPAAATEVTAIP